MASTRGSKPSRGDLLDAAYRTAVDHVGYRKYASEADALKSLRGRCRGFTPAQYEGALKKGIGLLASVEAAIAPFDPPFDGTRALNSPWSQCEQAVRELRRRCPGFRLATCQNAIFWTLLWYHWK